MKHTKNELGLARYIIPVSRSIHFPMTRLVFGIRWQTHHCSPTVLRGEAPLLCFIFDVNTVIYCIIST